MKNRDSHARRAYAEQRVIMAIDRFIRAKSTAEKEKARQWAAAWHALRKTY